MATAIAKDGIKDTKLGIETTVMAVREELMRYFKGTCVERVTQERNVAIVRLSQYIQRRRYQYEREQLERENACLIFIGEVPIITVKQIPDRVILHSLPLSRSPQLREVRTQLEDFLQKYLMGVSVQVNEKGVSYAISN